MIFHQFYVPVNETHKTRIWLKIKNFAKIMTIQQNLMLTTQQSLIFEIGMNIHFFSSKNYPKWKKLPSMTLVEKQICVVFLFLLKLFANIKCAHFKPKESIITADFVITSV